jgi:hypothetical protein
MIFLSRIASYLSWLTFFVRSVALAFSLPTLAATLAFVTYTHVVDGFDVAVIFSSLSLFQVS